MKAVIRYWHNFARWVKHGHAKPLKPFRLNVGRATGTAGHIWTTGTSPWLCNIGTLEPIPVESWTERKRDFERAQRAHRGQRDTYAKFRKATNAVLIEQIFADADKCERLVDTHPWLFRDPDAFVAAVKATARRRVQARR